MCLNHSKPLPIMSQAYSTRLAIYQESHCSITGFTSKLMEIKLGFKKFIAVVLVRNLTSVQPIKRIEGFKYQASGG